MRQRNIVRVTVPTSNIKNGRQEWSENVARVTGSLHCKRTLSQYIQNANNLPFLASGVPTCACSVHCGLQALRL